MNQLTETEETLPLHFEGLTKAEISDRVVIVVDSVLERGNVFVVVEAVSAMAEFAKQVRDDERIVNYCREELIKNNGRVTTPSGAKIETAETGVKYDYSNNPEWVTLDKHVKELTEQRKSLEERLKKIPAGKLLVDEETGESLVGPGRSSTSNFKITLAKK